jgi:hypothetical protein
VISGTGSRRTRAIGLAGLLALAALSVGAADRGRRTYFSTADEPDHVRACRQLRSGPGVVSNFEHPVLMKLLGAAGLPPAAMDRPVEEIRSARRVFPFVLGLLVVVAGGWATYRAGPLTGLAVAALVGLEPSLRGHAPLVHTDLLLTTLLVAAAAALDLSGSPRSPRKGLLVLSGAVYGLALVAKYSALPFLPVFLAAATFRIRGFSTGVPPSEKKGRRGRGKVPRAGALPWHKAAARSVLFVGLPALLVGACVQQAVVGTTTTKANLLRGVDQKFRGYPYHREAMGFVSTLPRGLSAYAAGLLWVRISAVPGARINYFLGEVSGEGSFLYFPVALALKLTTATVALLLAAAVAAGIRSWRGTDPSRRRRLRLLAARALLPALLGAAYLGAAMLSNVNIGVRHVFPAVPLFLVAAAGVVRTVARPRLGLGLLAVVVALSGLEAVGSLGREIPFGNRLAGGASGLRRVLSDSNVDWGERLGDVFERAKAGDLGRVGVVSLFWDPVEARSAGVDRLDEFRPGDADTVFVSVFIQDLGEALERSSSAYPKLVEFRGFFPPLLEALHRQAASVEPFRDEYLLIRLRPVSSPPAPTR